VKVVNTLETGHVQRGAISELVAISRVRLLCTSHYSKVSNKGRGNMGDKSKKDKDKSQKQKTGKQDQKAKVTQDRNRKKPQ
jgi:hypothetical protein